MKKSRKTAGNRGFALIGILLALVIAILLYYIVLKPYFAEIHSKTGMDTSSPAKIIDGVKKTLKQANDNTSDY
jgi:hypothetical protein